MTPHLPIAPARPAAAPLTFADHLACAALVAWFAWVGVAMLVAAGAP